MPAPSTVLYRRDLLGRLVAAGTAADPKAFGGWRYRGDGALAQETLKAGENAAAVTRSFAYDGLGRPVSIHEPSLTLAVSYRKDGDPATPYAHGGITAETVTYKPAGFATGAAVPQGSTTTYTYDPFGRLVTARSSERPVLDVDAAYDGNGNLGSLAQAGTSRDYRYEEGTNKLDKVMLAGTEQTYDHDAAGRVTKAAGTSLVRDPATGQMRRGTKDGRTVAVLRDGRGRIVLTMQGATKRLTVRDKQGAILLEREGASLAAVHVQASTGWIGLWTGSASYAVAKDLRGSTQILYGADGKAAAWLSYCAYGATDVGASSSNALTGSIRNRYTDQDWLDTLALYDYGARLYDPALGRFLSPDPKNETPCPYMYVAGDPVIGVDPSGSVIATIVQVSARSWVGYTRRGHVIFTAEGDPTQVARALVDKAVAFRTKYPDRGNPYLSEAVVKFKGTWTSQSLLLSFGKIDDPVETMRRELLKHSQKLDDITDGLPELSGDQWGDVIEGLIFPIRSKYYFDIPDASLKNFIQQFLDAELLSSTDPKKLIRALAKTQDFSDLRAELRLIGFTDDEIQALLRKDPLGSEATYAPDPWPPLFEQLRLGPRRQKPGNPSVLL